jgi:hypothetical protein
MEYGTEVIDPAVQSSGPSPGCGNLSGESLPAGSGTMFGGTISPMAIRTVKPAARGVCQACGYESATLGLASCPDCGGVMRPQSVPHQADGIDWLSVPPMLYQRVYLWFVLVSALDIMFTWTILSLGGKEVNVIADAVIAHTGFSGMMIYKFCLVLLVVVICEVVGRRRRALGRILASWSVAVTAIPVVLSLIQLLAH